jgi:hypothetical protein
VVPGGISRALRLKTGPALRAASQDRRQFKEG